MGVGHILTGEVYPDSAVGHGLAVVSCKVARKIVDKIGMIAKP